MADSDQNFRLYIELQNSVKASLKKATEESGQSQVVLLSRLVNWFTGQDARFRAQVAAGDSSAIDILVQQRLAALLSDSRDEKFTNLTFEQAAALARDAIAQMERVRQAEATTLGKQMKDSHRSK